ncbi:NAD-dependent epimerase/dehydratase family protein [Sutcliffiella rhizosphaerae]|uniref:Uncharacterized protein n=1 Tax=Sutcliffiella rhizosphaerae TaxID=2880967 RepID=A0ABM8YU04_9BACI|nr:hypothetical protein [Sutcliffiella rhizosphaerae]CAG9623456.1 hypothetical protein BACCIP111883_04269 [Sutcliffiella rhizosphaerae]
MKKAVVIGVTSHIGFALCQKLISKEVEVTGFEWPDKMDENSEEKIMQIGRNAFFQLHLNKNEDSTFDVAFMCIDEKLRNNEEEIKLSNSYSKNSRKLILLSNYTTKDYVRMYKDEIATPANTIYFPTLYGPWQPEHEIVHMRILDEMKTQMQESVAIPPVKDIIYVDDAADAILDIATTPIEGTDILLKNENPLTLHEIYQELNILIKSTEEVETPSGLKEFKVTNSLTIQDGLDAQRNCIKKRLNKR